MNFPAHFRSRRGWWLLAWGSIVLGAGLIVQSHVFRSSAENKVHAYFAAASANPYQREKLAAGLGTDAIPFLISFLAKTNSDFRLWLAGWEEKLAGVFPNHAVQSMLDATDTRRRRDAAWPALWAISRGADAPDALAPYLKHPVWSVRGNVISCLTDSARSGSTNGFCYLTNALPQETYPYGRVVLARYILEVDHSNAAALAVLRAALTDTNAQVAAEAKVYFQLRPLHTP